jgi:hypothetical protein
VSVSPCRQVFLLSPAHCGGKRAGYLLNENAQFALARRFHSPAAAPLGEVFSFLSGLYFRGKLAYAARFARPPRGAGGAYVITSNRGLLPPETLVSPADLQAFGATDISSDDPEYRLPLERDARALLEACGGCRPACRFVLLGSVATGKYVDVLAEVFRDRLVFPPEFAGRGDMSRGGLMLRCVDAGAELAYAPVLGGVRRGRRPPKLAPREPVNGLGEANGSTRGRAGRR